MRQQGPAIFLPELQPPGLLDDFHPPGAAGCFQGSQQCGRIDKRLTIQLQADRLLPPISRHQLLDALTFTPGRLDAGPGPALKHPLRIAGQLPTQVDTPTGPVPGINSRLLKKLRSKGCIGLRPLPGEGSKSRASGCRRLQDTNSSTTCSASEAAGLEESDLHSPHCKPAGYEEAHNPSSYDCNFSFHQNSSADGWLCGMRLTETKAAGIHLETGKYRLPA